MSFSPGTRVGAYEIIGLLGAGGMGEVYRARDTRLDRDVAVKILPSTFASDPERLLRFEREAKTLASLNHPHIAQVYGLEQTTDRAALVMELVEGEDLSDRITRGPLPIDDALGIALQISEALEAAHESRVIHRDLKPANVKLRPDGSVKVLDFGLAKPIAPAGSDVSAAPEPTITTPAMTLQGVVLGTAAYMAPEQAKGKPVDRRADIWALGCVLYEMLTGRRAFEGEDVSDTLAAILRSEPDWNRLPRALPPAITNVLKRCLERDVRRRVSSISTVRYVLAESTAETISSPAAVAPVPQSATALWRRAMVAVTGIVIVGLIATVWYLRASPLPPAAITRFQLALPEGQVLAFARRIVDLSPDGQSLAYVTDRALFLRRFAEFDAVQLASDSAATWTPTFSPDGAWVAFYSASERALKRVSVNGGAALRICEVPAPWTLTWDASGLLLGTGLDGVWRCHLSGAAPEQLIKPTPGEVVIAPHTLPGGDALIMTVGKAADTGGRRWDRAQIVTHALRTGERTVVINAGSDSRLLNTGHLLYQSGGVIYAVPFDPQSRSVRGDPVAVIEGVRRGTGGPSQMTISASGSLVYLAGPVGRSGEQRVLMVGDRGGNVTRLPVAQGLYAHVRASRDGSRIAVGTDDGTTASVLIYALDGKSAMQRLTLDGRNELPIWSPDGQWLAYASNRGGRSGIYRQRADGTGGPEQLTIASEGELHVPESWSPDGRHISYAVRKTTADSTVYALWILTVATKNSVPFGDLKTTQPLGSVFSPNGRWIAYAYTASDDVSVANRGVFVQPFPATGAVFQVPRQLIDFHPMWSADGRELVFLASATAGVMAAVRVDGIGSLTFATPVQFAATLAGERLSTEPRAFDLLPDGRIIGPASGAEGTRSADTTLRVVMNWIHEFNQRVGAAARQ